MEKACTSGKHFYYKHEHGELWEFMFLFFVAKGGWCCLDVAICCQNQRFVKEDELRSHPARCALPGRGLGCCHHGATGHLRARSQGGGLFKGGDLVIIDEAHERSPEMFMLVARCSRTGPSWQWCLRRLNVCPLSVRSKRLLASGLYTPYNGGILLDSPGTSQESLILAT